MKNVYEIKQEKNLNYILPKKDSLLELKENILRTVIIVIHIYYFDRINMYLRYIENIPDDIFILITVSEEKTKRYINSFWKNKTLKYKVILKPNRGRDVSSLLIAARKEILNYKYVCFLHDKKEKNLEKKKDIEHWNYTLLENSIGSKSFIENIIYTFEKNESLGLLVPPSPITENLEYGYFNTWGKDFELVKLLVNQMNLTCDLDDSFPPITLGTVFWAKTDALKTLFQIEWKYNDFAPEPLPDDGTLSHAIERILPYVAQDSGYETGWVMTDQYAAEEWEYHINILGDLFRFLEDTYKTIHISKGRRLLCIAKELPLFCENYKTIYIYGAGQIGRQCLSMLISLNISPESFLVSKIEKDNERKFGMLIQSIESVVLDETCGTIIAVGMNFINEIQDILFAKGVLKKDIFIFA